MLNHRGKIFRTVVDKYCNETRMSISKLTKEAGYDQSTIYRHFEKEDLAFHIIKRYGKIMKYDFTKDFPEMAESDFFETEQWTANNPDLDECLKQSDMWKSKYLNLLEQHNALLMEKLSGA